MQFCGAGLTNVGRIKSINQDGYIIKIAETEMGDVALVAVADGMGGLEKGELASTTVLQDLSYWFDKKLPISLEAMESSIRGFEQFVEGQWNGFVQDLNLKIMRYGKEHRMNLGTTLTAMLTLGGRYSIVHVGDTRAYEIRNDDVHQLTVDQTFIHREIEAGNITPKQALSHPQRNVLLQCIGSSKEVVPDLIHDNLRKDANYLLCSDGFRHVLNDEDFIKFFSPQTMERRKSIDGRVGVNFRISEKEWIEVARQRLKNAIQLVMARREQDNITAVLLRVKEER